MSSATSSAGRLSSPSPCTEPPTSLTTTVAPWRASSRASPLPIPWPAPVTMATFPSSSPTLLSPLFASRARSGAMEKLDGRLRSGPPLASAQPVQLLRVLADHPAALGLGHAPHRLLHDAPAVGPVVAVVGVVRRPHHVVDADPVAVGHGEGLPDEVRLPVPPEVLAGQQLERRLRPGPIPPVVVVHVLEEVGDPPHPTLDGDHLETREAVVDSGVDELRHELRGVADRAAHLGQADLPAGRGGRFLERSRLALAGLAQAGVDVDGHLLFLGRLPEGIVLGGEIAVPGGVGGDDDALVAG